MFAKLKRATLSLMRAADEYDTPEVQPESKPEPKPEPVKELDEAALARMAAAKRADERHFHTVCLRVQRWLKHHDVREVDPPGHIRDKIVMVQRRDRRLYEAMVAHAVTHGSAYVQPIERQ